MKPIIIKNEHRTARIEDASRYVSYPYAVYFYYDGECDFEWKRGAGGMNVELCNTIEQAKRKAKYYVQKG